MKFALTRCVALVVDPGFIASARVPKTNVTLSVEHFVAAAPLIFIWSHILQHAAQVLELSEVFQLVQMSKQIDFVGLSTVRSQLLALEL